MLLIFLEAISQFNMLGKLLKSICKLFSCKCHSDCDFKTGVPSPKKQDLDYIEDDLVSIDLE